MELIGFEKVRDGKYLKNYELTYLNKSGREKKFEIVSHRDMTDPSQIGTRSSGVSIAAVCGDKMLLLREFRMGVNRFVYNLCAGMIQPGETVEECVARELYEETGLQVKKITAVLPPAYAAVAMSDAMNQLVFAEVEGVISEDHTSENELIEAAFYSKDEVKHLVATEPFSARAQAVAYYFACM
ncbi:MAG: NUDIX hydrolase [Acetatifactor sp.]